MEGEVEREVEGGKGAVSGDDEGQSRRNSGPERG